MGSAKRMNLVIASYLPLLLAVIAFFILPEFLVLRPGPHWVFASKYYVFVLPVVILVWSYIFLFFDTRTKKQTLHNLLAVNYGWLVLFMIQILYTLHRHQLLPSLLVAIVGLVFLAVAFFIKDLEWSRLLAIIGIITVIASMFLFR